MTDKDIQVIGDSIWTYIRDRYLKEYLANHVRFYRAEVITAPTNGVIEVQRPFDTTISLPYAWTAASLTAGDQCLVLVLGGDSNAIVVSDGALSTPPST